MSGILSSIAGATYAAPVVVVNNAVALNGSNQYYNTSAITTTATDSKYFTFASTFYWGTNNYNQGGTNLMHLINVYLPQSSGNSFYIWINGGRMQVDGGCGTVYETAEDSLVGNAWNNVVFYFDSSSRANCRVYINGVSKTLDTGGNPNNTNINWGSTNAVVTIGAPNNNVQSAGNYFGGKIAQLYLHNASGAPDIAKYWDSSVSKPYDLGTTGTATGLAQPLIYHYGTTSTFPTNNGTGFNSYTLTANNSPTNASGATYSTNRIAATLTAYGNAKVSTAQSKFGGASALFDGTTDYLIFSSSPVTATDNFTFEGWIRFTATPGSGSFQMLGSTSATAYFAYANASGTLRFEAGVYGTSGDYYEWWNTTLSTATWYHFAFVKSSTTLKAYLNGTSLTSSGTYGTMSTDKHLFGATSGYIGAWNDTQYSVNGYMDEIRISKTARYTTTFTPSTSAFTNDTDTRLLLHCDGTNNSTTFTDDNA
jgi:hypothetical protein